MAKDIKIILTAEDRASGPLGRFDSNLDRTGANTKKISAGMVTAITAIGVATVALGKQAFDAAVKWESAFAGVRKTVDATEAQFAELEEQLLDLSEIVPLEQTQLAGIAELGGQLGIARDDIIGFTDTVAKIGVTTNLTTEEAATSFAQLANIIQLPVDELDNLASAVVDLGNNSATTERDIVAFSQRIAGAGNIAGLSAADIAGISAAFASVGIEAEAGGTAVQKTLMTLNQAVAEGGAELEAFAAATGMTSEQFATLFDSNPAAAFNEFVVSLGNAGDDASGILADLVGEDVRLQRAFLSLANAGGLLEKSIDTANGAFEDNLALNKEAEQRFRTTESRLTKLGNRFNRVLIQIGEQLIPPVVSGLEAILDAVTSVSDFIGANFGPAFEAASGFIEELTQAFQQNEDAMNLLSTTMQTFQGIADLVVATFVMLDTLLRPIIEGIVFFIQSNWDTIASLTGAAFGIITNTIQTALDVIRNVVAFWAALFQGDFQGALNAVAGAFSAVFNGIVTQLQNVLAVIMGVVTLALTALKDAVVAIFNALGVDIVAIWSGIQGTFAAAMEFITGIVTTTFEIISGVIQTIWNGIASFFGIIWENISGVFMFATEALRIAFEFWLTTTQLLWETVWNAVSLVFTTVWTAIQTTGNTIWNAMSSTATTIWNGIKTTLGGIWNAIKGIFEGTWNAMNKFIRDLWDALTGWFSSDAKTAIEGAFTNAMEGLGGIAKSILNGVISVIEGFINTAVNAINELIKAANSIPFNPIQLPLLTPVALGRLYRGGVVGVDGYNNNNVQTFQDGGIVRGQGGIDNVPILATAGEIVLNAAQQQNLANNLEGRGNVVINVNVSGNDFVAAGEDLARQVGDSIMAQFKQQFAFESF